MGSERGTIPLGTLCSKVLTGGTPLTKNKEFYENGTIPWLKTKEVNFNFITETENYISELGLDGSSAKLVPKNSVIVAMYGQGDTAGRVAINKIPLTTNQACCNLVVDSAKADYRFVYYYLKYSYAELVRRKTGSAQPNLNTSILKEFEIVDFSLKEQIKIGDLLEEFDKKIALNRQINQTLEQMAQTLFKSWFVDFDPVIDNALDAIANGQNIGIPEPLAKRFEARKAVRESEGFEPLPADIRQLFPCEFEESELGFVPKGWGVEGLSNYITFSNGKARKNADEGTYPLYGANGIIGFSDEAKFNDAIIIGRVGAYCGAIEYCHSAFWGSDNTIVAQAKKEQQLAFILYLLKYLDLNKYAGGAAQPLLNQKVLNGLKFSFSSDLLIKKFTDIITINLEKIVCNNTENDNLEHLRDTLLPKLISGELRLDSPQGEALQQAVSAE